MFGKPWVSVRKDCSFHCLSISLCWNSSWSLHFPVISRRLICNLYFADDVDLMVDIYCGRQQGGQRENWRVNIMEWTGKNLLNALTTSQLMRPSIQPSTLPLSARRVVRETSKGKGMSWNDYVHTSTIKCQRIVRKHNFRSSYNMLISDSSLYKAVHVSHNERKLTLINTFHKRL